MRSNARKMRIITIAIPTLIRFTLRIKLRHGGLDADTTRGADRHYSGMLYFSRVQDAAPVLVGVYYSVVSRHRLRRLLLYRNLSRHPGSTQGRKTRARHR